MVSQQQHVEIAARSCSTANRGHAGSPTTMSHARRRSNTLPLSCFSQLTVQAQPAWTAGRTQTLRPRSDECGTSHTLRMCCKGNQVASRTEAQRCQATSQSSLSPCYRLGANCHHASRTVDYHDYPLALFRRCLPGDGDCNDDEEAPSSHYSPAARPIDEGVANAAHCLITESTADLGWPKDLRPTVGSRW